MKDKIYSFCYNSMVFSIIFAVVYWLLVKEWDINKMMSLRNNNVQYLFVLFGSVLFYMVSSFVWHKIFKPIAIMFLVVPSVNTYVTNFLNTHHYKMHNVIKWIIISTLVAGIIAIYKFLGTLFKEVTIRVFSYAWDSTGRILSRIKMRLFSKRKEPCSIDLTLDQIDAFGDKKSSDYAFIKGRMFEDYIANLYRTAGYNAKTTTELRDEGKLPPSIQKRGGSGEQGVDVLVEIPQKNGTVKLLAIQCKHYSNKVENSAVQEISTALAMYKADQGCVITNNLFTGPAKDLALANNVILVDRHALAKMIEKVTKQYYESNDIKKPVEEKTENVLQYSKKKIKTNYSKNDEFWKKVS